MTEIFIGIRHRMLSTTPLIFILVLFFSPTVSAEDSVIPAGRIRVIITGLRSDSGSVRAHLYRTKKGFPSTPADAYRSVVEKIDHGSAIVVFSDIPYGEYAISVMHDENNNGRMDFNWLMIPKEGLGSSNNVRSVIPPSFDDSLFRHQSTETNVPIGIRY